MFVRGFTNYKFEKFFETGLSDHHHMAYTFLKQILKSLNERN